MFFLQSCLGIWYHHNAFNDRERDAHELKGNGWQQDAKWLGSAPLVDTLGPTPCCGHHSPGYGGKASSKDDCFFWCEVEWGLWP